VLPFQPLGEAGANAYLADALADELIADLARLRWLFVIARGSSFRFRGPQIDCRQIGAALGVGYYLTGTLAFSGPAVRVSVELVDTASGGIVWADTYAEATERIRDLQADIASRVVSALEIQIPSNEARLAREHGPEGLGAWAAYHLGLDHMYRFNRTDNARAAALFAQAVERDPHFARGYAGLSFTHFQNAFLNYALDRAVQIERALELAHRAVGEDQLDPFCHLNVGRSLWLAGDLRDSIEWLDRATMLSPSHAQSVYSRAWARTLSGNPEEGEADARLALQLSPLDPLRYAMLATCALSQMLRGNAMEAAMLSERAARSPGAHKYIAIIAALATSQAGLTDRATQWLARARQSDPRISGRDFLNSFPFVPSADRELIEQGLAQLGLPAIIP
jgi:TolB-like protein